MPDKLISICLVILISFQVAESQKYPTFEQYVLQFNKTYSSAQEFEARRRIYLDNLQRMRLIEIEMGFETGVNQFADRTQTEINQMKNQKLRPLYRSVTPHYSIKRKVGGPSSLDWRAKGAVTSIKNQGYCGSCWAFSTAAFCESSLIINNGFKNDTDLSEQYLLECTQESDCKGGFPAYALLTVLNHGIPREETFPYKPEFQYPSICESRKNLKIKGKQVYVYFTLSDFEMIYLLQTSPVIVGVGSQGWEFYKGGILKCRSNVTEDHAVLLVGYTPDYWIIKNQWGLEWGEKGFARISRNREQNCLMGVQVDTLGQKHVSALIFALVFIMAIIIG